MEQRIYHTFQASIEAKMHAGETLAPLIATAAERMVECLLQEGKILCCGNGPSAALSQLLVNNLTNRFERERPGLPAITLGSDLTSVTSIANEASFHDIFAREINVIGNPGDILVAFSSSGNPPNLLRAVQAAHDKNITIIVLSGRDGGNISALLDANDLELRVPNQSRARIHEIHLLTLFCLCDLIDECLFGPIENEVTL